LSIPQWHWHPASGHHEEGRRARLRDWHLDPGQERGQRVETRTVTQQLIMTRSSSIDPPPSKNAQESIMAAEWDRFKFEVGGNNSAELTTVRHIAHVLSARRIVEDGRIKAGLVYDESRLNKSRINVAWVSANTWALGSIYGTVEFQFTWLALVAGQKIYWVEAKMNYSPPAYRLLLSKRDISGGTRYDPAKDEGPLRLKDGKYYWNAGYTSEFMVEDDLSLDRCIGINFVTHHRDYCRPLGTKCQERQQKPSPQRTGGRLLSFVFANGQHILDEQFKSKEPLEISTRLDTAYGGLEQSLSSEVQFAGAISTDDQCQHVVRGSLALYGADQIDEARNLLSLMSSKNHFTTALKAIVRSHFGDPAWEPNEFF
jgi:hypothetical protein